MLTEVALKTAIGRGMELLSIKLPSTVTALSASTNELVIN
jgi:hypothetical protein